jgi:cell division protein FtsQ
MKGLGGVDKATLRERRRFAARRLRGRLLAWRYLLIGLVLGLVAVLASWGLWFHGYGRAFDLSHVDIVGANAKVTPAMIEAAAHLPVGKPLIDVDLGAIEYNVVHDPATQSAVLSADVTREWPNAVKIVVTVRVPVAAVNLGKTCQAMDETGHVFFQYPSAGSLCPKPLDSLPLVQSLAGSDPLALAQAAGVAGQLPVSLRAAVKYIEVASADGITLVLKGNGPRQIPDNTPVIWGSADNTRLKAQVLASVMSANPGAVAFNVSVPSNPAVTPK